jgi:hypothetical protein
LKRHKISQPNLFILLQIRKQKNLLVYGSDLHLPDEVSAFFLAVQSGLEIMGALEKKRSGMWKICMGVSTDKMTFEKAKWGI